MAEVSTQTEKLQQLEPLRLQETEEPMDGIEEKRQSLVMQLDPLNDVKSQLTLLLSSAGRSKMKMQLAGDLRTVCRKSKARLHLALAIHCVNTQRGIPQVLLFVEGMVHHGYRVHQLLLNSPS